MEQIPPAQRFVGLGIEPDHAVVAHAADVDEGLGREIGGTVAQPGRQVGHAEGGPLDRVPDIPLGPHGFEPAGGSLDLRRGGGGALKGQGHAASWGTGLGGIVVGPSYCERSSLFGMTPKLHWKSRDGTIPATPPSSARSGEETPIVMPKSTGRNDAEKGARRWDWPGR